MNLECPPTSVSLLMQTSRRTMLQPDKHHMLSRTLLATRLGSVNTLQFQVIVVVSIISVGLWEKILRLHSLNISKSHFNLHESGSICGKYTNCVIC
jgi:hypothetical protein